ncbi:dTDP-4-dehydrorhamnose 3,5-epimerase [Hellea sp.]|nr:dTDP-4-dehydrorhamnose 3,5-epimerase [Hellea sp.]MDC1088169.1 dTDP-4-dehydrorhamnose 3,5-epimerase [Hellea sp.]
MNVQPASLPNVFVFTPRKFSDERGYFFETFRQYEFNDVVGENIEFVQENQSYSKTKGTVRGLHYQKPPFAQGKLVRCIRGELNDVIVDIRKASPHYSKHIIVHLSAKNRRQVWIPPGFLHGFVTLAPNTEICYKCTNYYNSDCDGGVFWADKQLAIDWGVNSQNSIVSNKDKRASLFRDFHSPF